MLQLIHESHQGADKCKTRGRTFLYWPGMSQDIETIVGRCHICLKLRARNPKEPLIPHDVPERPRQKVAADIMTFKSRDYIVAVDSYSKYPKIALLENKIASNVIIHLKSNFARHGIPEEMMSDNMPFASQEFTNFGRDWSIKLTTSSPNFPQSNGQNERAVQTLKRILKKADCEGRDPYVALLEYRNTPVAGALFSPAQMLMSRMLRAKLPAISAQCQLQQRQDKYRQYYDRGSKRLTELQPGSVVCVRHENVWEPAVVIRKEGHPRSYIVTLEGREYRRNRRHLMNTAEKQPETTAPVDVSSNAPQQLTHEDARRHRLPTQAKTTPTPQKTSRGRIIRRPLKLAEYVCD